MYSGYTGRTCNVKPPCPPRYESFRMTAGGPLCCRLKSHDKGCPMGKFKCPITNKCVCIKNMKKYHILAEWRRHIITELNQYAVNMDGKRRLPSFAKTLRGITGTCKEEKLEKARIVLASCKRAGIPITRIDRNGFKSFSTLKSQCKAHFTACGKRWPCPVTGQSSQQSSQRSSPNVNVDKEKMNRMARHHARDAERDVAAANRHTAKAEKASDPFKSAVHDEQAKLLAKAAKDNLTASKNLGAAAATNNKQQQRNLLNKARTASNKAHADQKAVTNVRTGTGVKKEAAPPKKPGKPPGRAGAGKPPGRPSSSSTGTYGAAGRARTGGGASQSKPSTVAANKAKAAALAAKRASGTAKFGFGKGRSRYSKLTLSRDLRALQNMF